MIKGDAAPPVALIDRLPNELMTWIFYLALSRVNNPSFRLCLPTIIGSVERRWRALTLASGSLWADIVMTFPHSSQQLAYTKLCLRRSKSHPLDLFLDFRDPDWDWDEVKHPFRSPDMVEILTILSPYVGRWRSVDLLSDTWNPIHIFLSHTQSMSPTNLQRLSLSRCNAFFACKGQVFGPVGLMHPIGLFGGQPLPSLHFVELVGVHVDWRSSPLHNSLQLSFKYLAGDVMPTFNEFCDILRACPHLEALHILGYTPRFPDDFVPGNTVVRLDHLSRFSLGFNDICDALKLLSSVSMPSLHEFALEDISRALRDKYYSRDASLLLDTLCEQSSLARTPFGDVHTLKLRHLRANARTWRRFLSLFIKTSQISLTRPNNELLASLHPVSEVQPEAPKLLPCLSSLVCRNVLSKHANALVLAVLARTGASVEEKGVVHLNVFRVHFQDIAEGGVSAQSTLSSFMPD